MSSSQREARRQAGKGWGRRRRWRTGQVGVEGGDVRCCSTSGGGVAPRPHAHLCCSARRAVSSCARAVGGRAPVEIALARIDVVHVGWEDSAESDPSEFSLRYQRRTDETHEQQDGEGQSAAVVVVGAHGNDDVGWSSGKTYLLLSPY